MYGNVTVEENLTEEAVEANLAAETVGMEEKVAKSDVVEVAVEE